MQFKYTYEETSFNSFYKPYYFIDNKRVSKEKFDDNITICKLKNMCYNTSYMTHKNNRTQAVFYYN